MSEIDEPIPGKIDFCKDMTLTYEDMLGVVKFVFELGADVKNKELIVYSEAMDAHLKDFPRSASNDRRVNTAFQQVLAYVRELGYKVEIID